MVVYAAEELPLDVLGPALDEFLVAEVEALFQVQQADDQADGQPQAAGRADAAAELAINAPAESAPATRLAGFAWWVSLGATAASINAHGSLAVSTASGYRRSIKYAHTPS